MRRFKVVLPFALALGWLFGLGALIARPLAPAAASTIQSLIDAAPAGGAVSLPAGTYQESLTVGKTLTLTGASGGTVLQAAAGQRVITVTAGNSLKLVNLTLTGGQTSGAGGAVYLVNGSLTLVNCLITQNSAAYGGGVFQDGPSGRVDVINSRIERNTSANHGGGLYVTGSAAFTNAQVLSNTASVHGGGAHVQNGRVDVLGGEFRNNRALGGNGGALNLNGDLSLDGAQIISNTAVAGGGVQQWNVAPSVYITSTRFERNTASSLGGGAAISGTLRVLSSTFASNLVNSAAGQDAFAGGLYASGTSLILGSTFTDNVVYCNNDGGCSHADGGGLYSTAAILSIINGSFSGNQAGRMGGGMSDTSITLTLVNAAFRGNRAGWGGGLNHFGGSPTLINVLFSGNAAGWGGGLLSSQAQATLKHVTFAGNLGFNFGGGLENFGGTVQLVNSVLWGNAGTNGPQLYTDLGGTTSATYSDIQFTGVYTGTGNLNADPQFVQPITASVAPTTSGDYHVRPGSPLIDHGTFVSVTTDLDGRPRPIGAGFDMGVYEFQPQLYLPVIFGPH